MRTCLDCSVSIDHRGHRSKRCEPCQKVRMAANAAQYRRDHPEKNLEAVRKYQAANPEKVAESAARRRAANPEKYREISRKYQAANAEKVAERKARYYAANPEKYREISRKYQAANAEKYREFREANRLRLAEDARKRYAANPEKSREYVYRYRAANPEKSREYGARHRARKLNQLGTVTKSKSEILAEQGGICVAPGCGVSIDLGSSDLDHHISLRWGGLHDDSNLQVLCISCNRSKGDKDPHAFARARGFLRWENEPIQTLNTP